MSWQDIVLTIGSGVFSVALLPTLFKRGVSPATTTSALTAGVLFTYVMVYATLQLWFSAVATGINGCLWVAVFVKGRRERGSLPSR